MSNQTNAETILITYEFDAPRELVFECFVDPKHLVHWSHAGDGWVTPYAETDRKVGGRIKIGYQSGDGSEGFDLLATYTELDPPARLAYLIDEMSFPDETGKLVTLPPRPVTVDFTDLGGRTRVDLVLTLEPLNSADLQRQGWTEHLINLEAYLKTL
jgi:uncharacterized protein YndB with AHSA1/START domain